MSRTKLKRKNQPKNPPRRDVRVLFPRDLHEGLDAIARMERWSMSRTVVEVVRELLKGRRRR